MINLNNSAAGVGFVGMITQDGVVVDKVDHDNHKIYLSIPEDSWAYHDPKSMLVHDRSSYEKNLKRMLIELMNLPDLKVFIKTYPGYWTKEQGDQKYKELINQIV